MDPRGTVLSNCPPKRLWRPFLVFIEAETEINIYSKPVVHNLFSVMDAFDDLAERCRLLKSVNSFTYKWFLRI